MPEPAADLGWLDEQLRRAARDGDTAALSRGYATAACIAEASGNPDGAGFYRTHAYVWALVAGDDSAANRLAQALREAGRLE
jgi:hypothetical protein